jgi:formylmethanofuran dehydrogenase subunit B
MALDTDKQAQMTTDPMPVDIVCPFCALVCDDVSLSVNNGALDTSRLICPKATAGFKQAFNARDAQPMLHGEATDWATALAHVRQRLDNARLPLFHGLVGDLADSKAAWSMAARYGGIVDHRDGDALARNLAVYQDSGWIVTSLGEVRNRADLVVWVGGDIRAALPRLQEKLLAPAERLHATGEIELIELGAGARDLLDETRTLLAGKPLSTADAAAKQLAGRLQSADYPVFAIGELDDEQPELTLRSASELVGDINEQRRAALLLMSTGIGDVTAQLSGAWHNGFGIRTSMAGGYPQQDLKQFSAQRLLDQRESDLLVWISSLSTAPPPPCEQPQIVFGHPAMSFDRQQPEVFLPVAVPGVHRPGFIHRGDGFRLLPLHAVTTSELSDTEALARRLIDTTDGEQQIC